jgi:hypothetical protein
MIISAYDLEGCMQDRGSVKLSEVRKQEFSWVRQRISKRCERQGGRHLQVNKLKGSIIGQREGYILL